MTLCPSVCVCLSVISRCPVEMDGRIELFLHEGSSVCIYTVSTKIRELSSRNLCQIADLKKFLRQIDCRNVLSTYLEKVGRSERDKLDRRRSTKLTIPPTLDR